ncbi:MAG: ATP-binding protein, partial [Quisquiliibacterium sp.]
ASPDLSDQALAASKQRRLALVLGIGLIIATLAGIGWLVWTERARSLQAPQASAEAQALAVAAIGVVILISALILALTLLARSFLSRNARTIKALELERANANLAAAAKKEFIVAMSHEFRTPLNSVVGLISLLRRTPLNPEQRRLLETATDATERLVATVNDVLDLSTLEFGKEILGNQAFDLRALIANSMSTASSKPANTQLDIRLQIDPQVPQFVMGDPERISRVLINLLSNAVKYTSEGSVTLTVVREDGDEQGDNFVFEVSDTGPGIPEQLYERIFEPFEQGSAGRLSSKRGTGLGLAICRRIAKALGGSLTVQSVVGRGSTFRFAVWLGRSAGLEQMAAGNLQAPASGLRILVAEHAPSSQFVIRIILEQLGHQAIIVENGADAVRAFERERFDLIIMDIQMPGMDGLSATKEIRSIEDERRAAGSRDIGVPIVGLTVFAQPIDRDQAFQCGMTEYLSKPVRFEDIQRLLAGPSLNLGGGAGNKTSTEYSSDEVSEKTMTTPPELPAKKLSIAAGEMAIDEPALTELVEALGSNGFIAALNHFE